MLKVTCKKGIYLRAKRENFLNMSNCFDENYVIWVPIGPIGPPDLGCPLGQLVFWGAHWATMMRKGLEFWGAQKGTPKFHGRPMCEKTPPLSAPVYIHIYIYIYIYISIHITYALG